jgi:hypothetical protein
MVFFRCNGVVQERRGYPPNYLLHYNALCHRKYRFIDERRAARPYHANDLWLPKSNHWRAITRLGYGCSGNASAPSITQTQQAEPASLGRTRTFCFSGFLLLGVSVRRFGHYRCFTPSKLISRTLVPIFRDLGPRASWDLGPRTTWPWSSRFFGANSLTGLLRKVSDGIVDLPRCIVSPGVGIR